MRIYLIMVSLLLCSATVFANRYNIDISEIPNGTYQGEIKAQYGHIYRVNVTVKNGKIKDITLTEKAPNDTAKKMSNAAFATMIKHNKISVNSTTTATWKDLVFNALEKTKYYK